MFQVLSVQQTRVSWTLSEESSTMRQFAPPKHCKWHAVLLGIHAESPNRKIPEFLGVILKTVLNPMVIIKVQQLRSLTLIILIRTPEFVGEFQTIIDNDFSKSISSIARDIGVSEFHIRQGVYENIQYSSYKIRKDKFLSQAMNKKKKEHAAKLLNKLKHSLQLNMLFFFFFFFLFISDEKNFCQDQIVNLKINCWLSLSPQDVLILMKTKRPVYIMVLGMVTSDSDIMPPFIFLHSLRLNTEDYIKCLEEVLFTNPSARAGYDTRSIFKRSAWRR